MKKILLCMVLAFMVVLSGCGAQEKRLTKDEYMTQLKTYNDKMIATAQSVYYSTNAKDIENATAEMKQDIKDMIALQGPKNLQAKEDDIDKALNDYLPLFDDALAMRVDKTMSYDDYMKEATAVDQEFADAVDDYNK